MEYNNRIEEMMNDSSENIIYVPEELQTKKMVDNVINDNNHHNVWQVIRKDLLDRKEFNQDFFNEEVRRNPFIFNDVPNKFVNKELSDNIDINDVREKLNKDYGLFEEYNLQNVPHVLRNKEFDRDVVSNLNGSNIIYCNPKDIDNTIIVKSLNNTEKFRHKEYIMSDLENIFKENGLWNDEKKKFFNETNNKLNISRTNNELLVLNKGMFIEEVKVEKKCTITFVQTPKTEQKTFLEKLGEKLKSIKNNNTENNGKKIEIKNTKKITFSM